MKFTEILMQLLIIPILIFDTQTELSCTLLKSVSIPLEFIGTQIKFTSIQMKYISALIKFSGTPMKLSGVPMKLIKKINVVGGGRCTRGRGGISIIR